MITDTALVSEGLAAAQSVNAPLFVGNGLLARRAEQLDETSIAVPFQGAMGISASVAFGWVKASGHPAVILEGDGNFLMGSPSERWLRANRVCALHLVGCNGTYATSGGQSLPVDVPDSRFFDGIIQVPEELRSSVSAWVMNPTGYVALAVLMSNPPPFPDRPTIPLADSCRALVNRLNQSRK